MGKKYAGVWAASQSSIGIAFTYQRVRCTEFIKLKPTPANLRRAANHRGAICDAIATGTFDYAVTFPESARAAQFATVPGQVIKLKDYLDSWLKERKENLKSSTYTDYRKTANLLSNEMGEINISSITRRSVKDFCTGRDCGNKRLANIQSVLRKALQDAVDDELIRANPLYGWAYTKRDAVKPVDDVDPFTMQEQADILDALPAQGRNLIQFALWTGLRTSELVALEWGDIDWRRGVFKVTKALTQAATDIEPPKTKAGLREVKLLAPAMTALRAQKAHTFLQGEQVFHNPRTGKPWTGDQAIRKTLWTHALKKAKVRYRRPYQTRHTYASMMLTAGERAEWAAAQMGHKDLRMFYKVYAKWMPDTHPEAGGAAVEMFSGGQLTQVK